MPQYGATDSPRQFTTATLRNKRFSELTALTMNDDRATSLGRHQAPGLLNSFGLCGKPRNHLLFLVMEKPCLTLLVETEGELVAFVRNKLSP
jgi:hypothetical protein